MSVAPFDPAAPVAARTARPWPFRRIKKYVVVVTTGRSGSHFFANLVNTNGRNASAEHEVTVVPPDLAASWYYAYADEKLGRIAEMQIRRLRHGEIVAPGFVGYRYTRKRPLRSLRRLIPQVPVREIYVNVDNAILKSFGDSLLDRLPDVQVVHLTRDPMLQAKSAVNRNSQPSPERAYFLWPGWKRNILGLREEQVADLSKFQLALWYWLEMEMRASALVERHDMAAPIEMDVNDLNQEGRVQELFAQLGIEHGRLALDVDRDRGRQVSRISDREREEASALLDLVGRERLRRITNTYGLLAL